MVVQKNLKEWEEEVDGTSRHRHTITKELTLEGLYKRLVKWIAVDNQVRAATS